MVGSPFQVEKRKRIKKSVSQLLVISTIVRFETGPDSWKANVLATRRLVHANDKNTDDWSK